MCMQTRKYLQYNVLEGAGTSEGNSTQYPGPMPCPTSVYSTGTPIPAHLWIDVMQVGKEELHQRI